MKFLDDGTMSLSVTGMMDFCKSPKHYKYFHIDKKSKETTSMTSGKLLHTAVFEPDEFDKNYYSEIEVPEEFTMLKTVQDIKDFLDSRSIEYKSWFTKATLSKLAREHLDNEEFTYLWDDYILQFKDMTNIPPALYNQVLDMTQSVHENSFFKNFVGLGECEEKMECLIDGIHFRGRLDWNFYHENMAKYLVTDLKQTVSARRQAFERTCYYQNYFVQAYLYSEMVKQTKGKETHYVYIAVEPNPPYVCQVFPALPAHIEAGKMLTEAKISHFKRCALSGIWPGYVEVSTEDVGLPEYGFRYVEEEYERLMNE